MDIQTTFESAGWLLCAPRMDPQRPGASKCNGPGAQVSTILIIARSIDLIYDQLQPQAALSAAVKVDSHARASVNITSTSIKKISYCAD